MAITTTVNEQSLRCVIERTTQHHKPKHTACIITHLDITCICGCLGFSRGEKQHINNF